MTEAQWATLERGPPIVRYGVTHGRPRSRKPCGERRNACGGTSFKISGVTFRDANVAGRVAALPQRLRRVAWHVGCKPRHQAMLIQPILLGAATGLASSMHCAAMCGPLAASACSRRSHRAALVRYQLGRTIGYAAAG